VVSTSTFTTSTTYLIKARWSSTDATGELFVCAYNTSTGDPFDSCITSEGTCNGADSPSDPNGWLTENSAIIIDDIFIDDVNLSD
jgi:hypothetical protein